MTGTWLSIGSPVIAELAAGCDLDWLLFDLEHGCGSEAGLIGNLQAVRGSRALAVVRVGAPHPDLVMRALDWGADGIMFPHVDSAEEAEACVQAVHYPPRGKRGFSRSIRAYAYGLWAPHGESVPPAAPLVMVQVETLNAVEQAASIARTEGVDVLFVGPADLKFDLQLHNRSAEEYRASLDRVNEAARTAGKATGILVRDPMETEALRQMGFTAIAIESDLSILRSGFQRITS